MGSSVNPAVALATELFRCRGVHGVYLILNVQTGFTRLFAVVDDERMQHYLQRVMKPDAMGAWPNFEESAQEAALSLLGWKSEAFFFEWIEGKYGLNLTHVRAEGMYTINLVPEMWQAKLGQLRALSDYGIFPASEWPDAVKSSRIFDPAKMTFVADC